MLITAKHYIIVSIYWLYHYLISKTPWRKAYILLALKKYTESDMFKERIKIIGLDYAINQYLDHDYWFFHRKVTALEKMDIAIRPYTYIDNLRSITVYIDMVKEDR